jgi:catechol 2,3-dioxygenase-like lactoylglutathione lyase family enzyme
VPGTAVPTLPVADADIPIKRRDDYARREVESGRCLMQIEFVASVAVITPTPKESRRLYIDALGLPLHQLDGEYFASEEIGGCKHFGVWPLEQAAQACFGASTWPDDIAVPQASLEFEVANAEAVAAGAEELRSRGYRLLHDARTEPWGQTVARLLSPEGAVVGLSYAPSLHQ